MKTLGVNFVRELLAKGRYVFTRAEAASALGRQGGTLSSTLLRLKRGGWVWPLGGDFFTIVDPANRGFGTIPPEWFLDDWARFRGVEYYIGGLSAAAMHGAAHQAPQVLQIAVNRAIRPFRLPSLRVQFLYPGRIEPEAYETRQVPSGWVRFSTPAVTAYDLLALRKACPSLDHAATVYRELGEAIRPTKLAALCGMATETGVLQRLGWMLDHTGWESLTGLLAKRLEKRPRYWVPLRPDLPRRGDRNVKWRLIENTDIQPDI
jgi:predicted transcriptional regulator of viral defense system